MKLTYAGTEPYEREGINLKPGRTVVFDDTNAHHLALAAVGLLVVADDDKPPRERRFA